MRRRHHQHVGRAGETAEGIERHRLAGERHVGGHLAIELEIGATARQDFDRLLHIGGALALGIAEGGVGEQRHARLVAELAGDTCGFLGDIGEFFRRRQFEHRGIGDEHGAAAHKRHRHADGAVAFAHVEHHAHVVEGLRIVAGEARHHGIGITHRHHAGAEDVAVLVRKALAVAIEQAVALQAAIEEVGVVDVAVGKARVQDLDVVVELDARTLQCVGDHLFAADEDRGTQSCRGIGVGGADHAVFLALGEDHALGLAAHIAEDVLQCACDGVETGRELGRIGLEVGDVVAGDTRFHGGARHGDGNARDEARIEGHRDQVFAPEGEARAMIGGGHFIGHVLAGEFGERTRGRHLHLLVDGAGPHIECAAEDVWEAQNVVHLVGIIRAARRHDDVAPHLVGILGRDLRIGIGHGEDDRVLGHALHHLGGECPCNREAEEDIGAIHGVGESAERCIDRMRRLPLVHAFGAALVDHALGVAEDDVLPRHTQ